MLPNSDGRHSRPAIALAFATLAAAAALWHPGSVSAGQAAAGVDPASIEFYTTSVQPILKANCYRCHGGGQNHRGGLKMDTQANFMHGGKGGPVLVPGHPEQSRLITLIRHEGPANDPMPMPPKSKLSDADIATVTAWIKAGAILPADPQ